MVLKFPKGESTVPIANDWLDFLDFFHHPFVVIFLYHNFQTGVGIVFVIDPLVIILQEIIIERIADAHNEVNVHTLALEYAINIGAIAMNRLRKLVDRNTPFLHLSLD